MDPTIISQITQLTMQGVRKVSEMRRHLDSFVNSELFKGQQPPEKMRRRFFPTNKDMYNHMYKAKVAHRFSALDQKNLDVLVKKWKAESPLDSFLYEPHCSTGNSNASMVPMAESNGDEPSDDVPDPQLRTQPNLCSSVIRQRNRDSYYTNTEIKCASWMLHTGQQNMHYPCSSFV